MENKKSLMADLIKEYGFGFEKIEEETKIAEEQENPAIVEEPKQEEIRKPEPKDITIKCKKCESDFIWTVRDQEFYKEKGFFRPAYCKECRKKTKVVNNFHKDI